MGHKQEKLASCYWSVRVCASFASAGMFFTTIRIFAATTFKLIKVPKASLI